MAYRIIFYSDYNKSNIIKTFDFTNLSATNDFFNVNIDSYGQDMLVNAEGQDTGDYGVYDGMIYTPEFDMWEAYNADEGNKWQFAGTDGNLSISTDLSNSDLEVYPVQAVTPTNKKLTIKNDTGLADFVTIEFTDTLNYFVMQGNETDGYEILYRADNGTDGTTDKFGQGLRLKGLAFTANASEAYYALSTPYTTNYITDTTLYAVADTSIPTTSKFLYVKSNDGGAILANVEFTDNLEFFVIQQTATGFEILYRADGETSGITYNSDSDVIGFNSQPNSTIAQFQLGTVYTLNTNTTVNLYEVVAGQSVYNYNIYDVNGDPYVFFEDTECSTLASSYNANTNEIELQVNGGYVYKYEPRVNAGYSIIGFATERGGEVVYNIGQTYTGLNLQGFNLYEVQSAPQGTLTIMNSVGTQVLKEVEFTGILNYFVMNKPINNVVELIIADSNGTAGYTYTTTPVGEQQLLGYTSILGSTIVEYPIGTPALVNTTENRTIYEVYKISSDDLSIVLYQNSGEPHRVDKTNYLTQVDIISGTFKDEVDLCHLTVDIQYPKIPNFNYIYVALLNKYYFVDKIITFPNGMYTLICTIDILMTYKEAIRTLTAFVTRNEYNYNDEIVDPKRVILQGQLREVKTVQNNLFDTVNLTSHNFALNGFALNDFNREE